MGINSFKRKTVDGVITYFYNGAEVSKEEFDAKRAAAKETQTELLGGITIEEKRKQIALQNDVSELKSEMSDIKALLLTLVQDKK